MVRKTQSTVSVLIAVAALWAVIPVAAAGGLTPRANSTLFGPNVFVFDPAMPAAEVQKTANAIFKKMEANEFGPERYALLFKPGPYDVTFNVGFYTHVAGLGQSPDDVHINGGVNVPAEWMPNANATCNFWRSLENFAVTPSATKNVTRIAVSQAAPLRRLHVKGDLHLFAFDKKWNAGWASGGFLADSVIDGNVVPASQQQWLFIPAFLLGLPFFVNTLTGTCDVCELSCFALAWRGECLRVHEYTPRGWVPSE